MNARLHILLPVHNRRETTLRFVEALGRQTWRGFRLVLIDDGSTDGTAEAVRASRPEVTVLRGDGDWWWAGALEQGCLHLERTGVADDDVLLFMNDDVVLEADFLARGMAELAQRSDTLLLARQRDAATGLEIDRGGGVTVDVAHLRFAAAKSAEEINCLPTRGLFLRWRDYVRAGGFRSRRLPHYLSDYEFTWRAGQRGLALRVAETAAVGVQTGSSGPSLATLFGYSRQERARLLFSRRFKDNPVTWCVFAEMVAPPSRRPWLWLKIWLNFSRTAARCVYTPVGKGVA